MWMYVLFAIQLLSLCPKPTELLDAVKRGEIERTEKLLKDGCNANIKNHNGISPLHLASSNGKLEMVKLLLKFHAEINAIDNHGRTPLFYAVLHGHTKIVKFLLSKGANPNIQDNAQKTQPDYIIELKGKRAPLHIAAIKGNMQIVKYLIKYGADVNIWDQSQNTPLHYAAKYKHFNVLKYLIEHGARFDIGNILSGKTPLHLAAATGDIKSVKYLVKRGADIFAKDHSGKPPIFYAIYHNHPEVVDFFVKKGFNVKEHPELIIWAAKLSRFELVKYFLDNGADINARNGEGLTPLGTAAANGNYELVKYLVEHGARIDFKVNYINYWHAPLFLAGIKDHLKVFKYLVEHYPHHEIPPIIIELLVLNGHLNTLKVLHECGVKIPDPTSFLFKAARAGNIEVLKILLKHGAYIDKNAHIGKSPIYYAAYYDHKNAALYLYRKGALINRLLTAVVIGDLNMVKQLVHRGENINETNEKKETLLHIAVKYNYPEIVEYLISHGADINTSYHTIYKENYFEPEKVETTRVIIGTPLHYAVSKGNISLVKILVEHGARLDLKDKNGRTPIEIAIEKGYTDITKYLLQKGSLAGTELLNIALRNKQIEIVKYLIDTFGVQPDKRSFKLALLWNNQVVLQLIMQRVSPDKLNDSQLLIEAAKQNNIQAVKFLVNKVKLNPEWMCLGYATPCHYTKNEEILKLLSYCGETPLHLAIINKDTVKIRKLLESGVDVNLRDSCQQTPLHTAASLQDSLIISLLLKYKANPALSFYDEYNDFTEKNACDMVHNNKNLLRLLKYCGEEFFYAVSEGDLEKVKKFIKEGIDINKTDHRGFPPLYYAIVNHHPEIVRLLLENGANPDVYIGGYEWSSTLLHTAVYEKQLEAVKYMMKYGANSAKVDDHGETPCDLTIDDKMLKMLNYCGASPLHYAVKKGKTNKIKDLLKKGINPNAKDLYGRTPLHLAASKNNIKIVKLLMEKGANPTIRDKEGHTPCDLTSLEKLKKIMNYCKVK